MKTRPVLAGALALVLLLTLLAGLVLAQEPVSPVQSDVQTVGFGLTAAALGTGFTYQGQLTDGGNPANGTYDFEFELHDAVTGGALIGTVTRDDVSVNDGLFAVALDFGGGIFNGDARWLEIGVRPGSSAGAYTTLSPRQPLTPAPYALALPGLWTQQNPTSPNVVGGYSANIVGSDVVGASIGGGGQDGDLNRVTADFGTVGGGDSNQVYGERAAIGGGGHNTASGDSATIAGGWDNEASQYGTAIGGGSNNRALGTRATVGGGWSNRANSEGVTIGGGDFVNVTGRSSTVAGGSHITVTQPYATVGGGQHNVVSGEGATIAGGVMNTAEGWSAVVGGGSNNAASGPSATVGGGFLNAASGHGAVVSGGGGSVYDDAADVLTLFFNQANGDWSTVGGGRGNYANAPAATVSGGEFISVTGLAATVAGGQYVTATTQWAAVGGGVHNVVQWPAHGTYDSAAATIAGGERNLASEAHATIGGGGNNTASGYASVVAGGGGYENYMTLLPAWLLVGNTASGAWSTVSGGGNNYASGYRATIGGGFGNEAVADYATIGGGGPEPDSVDDPAGPNRVTDAYGTIGGGSGNLAGGDQTFPVYATYATVSGGRLNKATWQGATVGGGEKNAATGIFATVGGGRNNSAGHDQATVGGGDNNVANNVFATVGGGSSNTASGWAATVPGGDNNTAEGNYSFAAGYRAKALHAGSFVWADTLTESDFESMRDNQFRVRAYGGSRFEDGAGLWVDMNFNAARVIDTSTDAYLSGGGVWTNSSDRAAKANFTPVDTQAVLASLAEMPISTWNYKAEDVSIRHLGPTAQDFYAAFDVGADDKHISTVDADGIALASIQGLYQLVLEQQDEITAQRRRINALETRLEALEAQPHALPGQANVWPVAGLLISGLFAGLILVGRAGGRRWRLGSER